MGVSYLSPLFAHELSWWFVLALSVASLFIGIFITNFLYRGTSWESLVMSDFWNYTGKRGTGLELYVLNVFTITFVVFVVLNGCVTYWVKGFQ